MNQDEKEFLELALEKPYYNSCDNTRSRKMNEKRASILARRLNEHNSEWKTQLKKLKIDSKEASNRYYSYLSKLSEVSGMSTDELKDEAGIE